MSVVFVDTSILCNLLPVPGYDQHRDVVMRELDEHLDARAVLILPVTAVIETGNHIAQLADGYRRRSTAEKFVEQLRLVIAERAPWRLHQFAWGAEFLNRLIAGSDTGATLVDHFTAGVGAGDLCILAERETYRRRTGISDVRLWTRDAMLDAHS